MLTYFKRYKSDRQYSDFDPSNERRVITKSRVRTGDYAVNFKNGNMYEVRKTKKGLRYCLIGFCLGVQSVEVK